MESALILDFDLRIPAEVYTLERFREWCRSEDFPETGRLDFLDGEVEIDMSPEDLYPHGVVKSALASALHALVAGDRDAGNVFVDRTRVSSREAGLSVEPDVVVVLWSSLAAGTVREVPAARGGEGRFIELEGAPDLVVEVVSDRSVQKDRERLPRLYARAGVPELWLADARGEELLFTIQTLTPSGYAEQPADADGWTPSPTLGREVRLVRQRTHFSRFRYSLQHR